MDINYHYFAVKVLAINAGFKEEDAQLISSYSQFVDDFDYFTYLPMKNVPEYAQHLATKVLFGWLFNPVTTGLNSFFDYVTLSISRYQKRILVPFHFIPPRNLGYKIDDRKEYRVKPVTLEDSSLLQGLLSKACAGYRDLEDRPSLIRIGTLLHILADTYAHQGFSGFWGWENNAFLKKVINNITDEDVTDSYKPNLYYNAPSVGHANVNTAPDDSNVKFSMLNKNTEDEEFPYNNSYERDNVTEFLKCSKVIINYLMECRELPPIEYEKWKKLSAKLEEGFLTTEKKVSSLINHWHSIFPDIEFHYNKNELIVNEASIEENYISESNLFEGDKSELLIQAIGNEDVSGVSIKSYNDDFFRYNIIAESIRKAVDPDYKGDIEAKNFTEELASERL